MASKFRDVIGYSMGAVETTPGVFEDTPIERIYRGDVSRVGIRARVQNSILPELDITHEFSILADPYAYNNIEFMRYIRWMGTLWNVRQVENRRPRLIIRVGGVYVGPTGDISTRP